MKCSIMVEVFVENAKDLKAAYTEIDRAMKIAGKNSPSLSFEITDEWYDSYHELISFDEIKEVVRNG